MAAADATGESAWAMTTSVAVATALHGRGDPGDVEGRAGGSPGDNRTGPGSQALRTASVLGSLARVAAPFLAGLTASAGVFLLAALNPSNPLAATVAGWEFASPQAKEAMKAAYRQDGWAGAWSSWLGTVLTRGDPGYSRTLHEPVLDILAGRGVNTLAATVTAALLTAAAVAGVMVLFSLRPGLAARPGVTGTVGAWLTLPSFLVAITVVFLLGPVLPNPARTAPIVQIPALAVVIAFAWAAPMVANVRAAAAEQAASPWGRALVGRGATGTLRIRAMTPGMARAAAAYGFVLIPQVVLGEAAVEAVFGYPGLGNALVAAAAGADLPLLATVTAIAAFLAAAVWAWWPRRAR